ncbi:hypothetical protein JCM13591A_23160 [Microbacterium xylanilyticum]
MAGSGSPPEPVRNVLTPIDVEAEPPTTAARAGCAARSPHAQLAVPAPHAAPRMTPPRTG